MANPNTIGVDPEVQKRISLGLQNALESGAAQTQTQEEPAKEDPVSKFAKYVDSQGKPTAEGQNLTEEGQKYLNREYIKQQISQGRGVDSGLLNDTKSLFTGKNYVDKATADTYIRSQLGDEAVEKMMLTNPKQYNTAIKSAQGTLSVDSGKGVLERVGNYAVEHPVVSTLATSLIPGLGLGGLAARGLGGAAVKAGLLKAGEGALAKGAAKGAAKGLFDDVVGISRVNATKNLGKEGIADFSKKAFRGTGTKQEPTAKKLLAFEAAANPQLESSGLLKGFTNFNRSRSADKDLASMVNNSIVKKNLANLKKDPRYKDVVTELLNEGAGNIAGDLASKGVSAVGKAIAPSLGVGAVLKLLQGE